MTITLKLFAILREKAGTAELPLDLPDGSSAGQAVELLLRGRPELTPLAARAACAVNMIRVERTLILNDGDELALLPPVSGG